MLSLQEGYYIQMSNFGDFLAGEVFRTFYSPPSPPYTLTDTDHSDILQKFTLFHSVTRGFPISLGIETSRQEVTSKHLTTNMSLTYGEIGE